MLGVGSFSASCYFLVLRPRLAELTGEDLPELLLILGKLDSVLFLHGLHHLAYLGRRCHLSRIRRFTRLSLLLLG